MLAFAGSDPSGGAGLQADLLTLASLGCHPLSVVTAVTVQDTIGVAAVQPVAAQWVTDQARAVLADVPVAAIKVGLIGTAENAAAIAHILAAHSHVPVVLDPVLASGRGDALADGATLRAMRELLVPLATVLTPNSIEVQRLAFPDAAATNDALDEAALRLVAAGAKFVVVTGTHRPTPDVINTLYGAAGVIQRDRWDRLPGAYHGSGCTFAAAVAAAIAHGRTVPDAVRAAQAYAWQTLAHGWQLGRGQAIPHRLFWAGDGAGMDAAR